MTGRPSKLTDELRDELCAHIAKPMAATHACALVGIHPATYFRWIAEGEADDATPAMRDFCEAVARAKAKGAERLIETLRTTVKGVQRARYGREGELLEEWIEYDTASARWLLERMHPDEFGNRVKVDQTTSGAIDIRLPPGAGDAAIEFVQKLGEQTDEGNA